MPTVRAKLGRWKVGLAFVVVTIAFIAQGVILKQTINDVQHDRIVSCRHTYEGVREIFKPFLPPPGKGTAKMRSDARKFNRRVDGLKARCDVQIGVARP